ncbi:MAG: response regulator [Deltaproteobacteria bacterium]|nr:response regulator [Deltaproteobacteria bacterium]
METKESTTFIVDNDDSLRDSLQWLLESGGIQCQGYASAEAFLAGYRREQAGCLLLDVRLPGMSGIVLQEEMVRERIELPVIVMTGYGDVGTAVSMLKRGAFDFFEKPFSDAALFERVQQAMEVDSSRRRRRAQREAITKRLAGLTAREREVFDQVVIGKPNKVVASEFGISEKTVEVHRARVMQKLGAASLAELVRIDLLAAQPTESMHLVRLGA